MQPSANGKVSQIDAFVFSRIMKFVRDFRAIYLVIQIREIEKVSVEFE